jgi:hypothetical protein
LLQAAAGWTGMFNPRSWMKLLSRAPTDEKTCSCGEKLPPLECVTFTFSTGREEAYLLGQCPRCGTVFWEEGGA